MARVTIKELQDCIEWKTCTKCDEEKKRVMFSKSNGKYRPSCKDCDSKAYYARKAKKAQDVVQTTPNVFKRLVAWLLG